MTPFESLIVITLALYFLPAFVAAVRFHPNKTAIFILNLLLGWTMLGWIGALIWSCTFVAPWSGSAQDTARDPRWANLRSTPTPKIAQKPQEWLVQELQKFVRDETHSH